MASLSLRSRFTIALTVVVVLLYGGTSWLVYSLAWRSGLGHLDERIDKTLARFVADIDWQAEGIDLDFHHTSPPEFAESSQRSFYELRDHQQRLVVRSFSLGMDELAAGRAAKASSHRTTLLENGIEVREATAAFRPPLDEDADPATVKMPPLESPENLFHLTVAESTAEIHQHLEDMASALGLGGLFLAAACIVVARLPARWLSRPIQRLASSAAGMDAARLDQRLPDDGTPAEMRPIVAQFNGLLDRLSAAMSRERRFSAAMAHELRTPVAELQTLAEVAMLEAGGESGTSEEAREVFTQAAALAAHMRRLIETLTAMHHSESGRIEAESSRTDLGAIVDRVQSALRADLAASGREVRIVSPDERVTAWCDPQLAAAAVTNLLSNALRHSPGRSTVFIHITSSPPAITVRNPAPDLTADDLPHLAEPLWQKDTARSQRGRFGLGLSLARSYSEVMGGRLDFALADGEFAASLVLRPLSEGTS